MKEYGNEELHGGIDKIHRCHHVFIEILKKDKRGKRLEEE